MAMTSAAAATMRTIDTAIEPRSMTDCSADRGGALTRSDSIPRNIAKATARTIPSFITADAVDHTPRIEKIRLNPEIGLRWDILGLSGVGDSSRPTWAT